MKQTLIEGVIVMLVTWVIITLGHHYYPRVKDMFATEFWERSDYQEIMARRERALDEENKKREQEQLERDLDVSALSNQPGVIRYTREIPKD